MTESIAGTYATLGGVEIVNDARTFAYLKNGLGPGSVNAYGDCSCPNLLTLLGCTTSNTFLTIDGLSLLNTPAVTGVSGAYASTPDSVALSIGTDIQLDAKIKPTTIIGAASVQNIIAKWIGTGGQDQRSYRLSINTAGGLDFSFTTTGLVGGIVTKTSTAILPFSNLDTFFIRASIDVDNGAAGYDIKFWYKTLLGADYTQLGATVTTAGALASPIFDSTAPVELGSQDNGVNNKFTGTIYSASIRNGISPAGFEVANPNFQPNDSAITPSNTTITDTYHNVWTRQNTATFLPGTGTSTTPLVYTSPAVDGSPWYSPDVPESKDFLGLIVDEFKGMDSPFKRTVSESVGNGAVLNRSRLGSRQLKWKGYLFGATCCSVQYGLRWLTKSLSRFGTTCKDCFGDDLELLVCCPDNGESPESPFRLLKGVALVEGPVITNEHKTCSSGCSYGCGGSCILEIEFTLVASQPYFYSPPLPVYDCVVLGDGADDSFIFSDIACPPFNCSDALFEAAGPCQLPVLPPTATYSSLCFTNAEGTFNRANYLSVPRSSWKFLEEVVPVITVTNFGPITSTGVKLSFYSSPDGNPCGDLLLNPPECDNLCDDLVLTNLPGGSTFYIDGRTRKMSLICGDNNTAFPGERHSNGPWSWPVFSDIGFCMQVLFQDLTEDSICVSLSLVPRTF